MNRPQLKNIKWNYYLLAFLAPFVGMLVFMLFAKCEPFGKYSMLYSDMYHQYYPFFKAYRAALLSGDSLLYSWNVGMGMDYLGLISYYLASPLYLLSVLVPENWLLEFFSLLMPVKLGLAGLFFAIFLKHTFKKYDLSIVLFGAFYAMCAWALGYQWNIMWLDGFALLPLVALGTVSLIRDQKFILYTAALFLAVYSNYYIGLFVCVFVFFLFFIYQICRWQGFKAFFFALLRIGVFSVLAIGMTAFLELPAFAALQNTQSSVNTFPEGFRLNIASENTWKGLLDAMRQVAGNMNGGLELNFKEGLPNLYCGVGTIVLAFLYLTAKDVKLGDKLCAVAMLLFFNVSFIIRQLDYIWHGFHFPNMIPYRFSFLYSFVMLYMAYRAWLLRGKFRWWQLAVAGVLALGVMACSDRRFDTAFLAYNLGFFVLYMAALIYGAIPVRIPENADEEQLAQVRVTRHQKRRYCRIFLSAVMAAELIVNIVNFGVHFTLTNTSNYPNNTTYSASVIRYMHEREEDTLFYRAETTHAQTLNDGALNGYNGISTFTSSANVNVTKFMKTLGYGAKETYNRYCYEEASPVANLFLNLKYMIERDGKDKQSAYFEEINRYGSTVLLENKAYLPLGFLAESSLAHVDLGVSGVFVVQNRLFSAATGVDVDVWRKISSQNLTITGKGTNVTDTSSSGYSAYKESESGSYVVYTYAIDQDGFMCVDLNLPKRNNVSIWRNGVELYSETMSLRQTLAVGDVIAGDVVEVKMSCKSGESGTMTLSAAILNEERFWEGYEILAQSPLELTQFSNTYVEGTIRCNRDGLLYTSIPQNGNWSVQVDGEEAEIVLVEDVMIAVELTEGSHTVSFTYRNAAFEMGLKITLGCAAMFALAILLVYKPHLKMKHGKYEK